MANSPAPRCRIIVDPEPNTASWNMAVDEALLESAIQEGCTTIRIYQWSEPSISLGYFQKPDSSPPNAEFSSLPTVQRLSGGGAILHHHELTYSCAIAASHALARSPHDLYEHIHDRVIEFLGRKGITAAMRGDQPQADENPFLCFGRADARDILFRGHKVLGSAQRRRRGAVLQHGSLLLKRSEFAPQFPGLLDLADASQFHDAPLPDSSQYEDWGSELAAAIGAVFAEGTVNSALTPTETERAGNLETQRCHRAVTLITAKSK